MTAPGLTYVYCAVRSARRPSLRGTSRGMPGGAPVRALDAGHGVWLVVSSVPDAAYGEPAIAGGLRDIDWVSRCALAHEAVVECFLAAPALLPMQLFTMFASDARAVGALGGNRPRLVRLLDRLAGKAEWGVRVTEAPRATPAAAGRAASARSGAEYLARRRDALQGARGRAQSARTAADRLYRAAARAATEAIRRDVTGDPAGSRVVLDAAFLVPVDGARAFRDALAGERPALAEVGVTVSVTGPWPGYNFAASPRPARRRPARPTDVRRKVR